jgi:lipopolysaccharide/colanic/teichoic acid biosynthesis glycosyltransferase
MYACCVKRLMDFMLSLLALVVLSPAFLIVAMLVLIRLGTPVIFKQKRAGIGANEFVLYKFRTMTEQIDSQNNPLRDSARLTKFGIRLRNCSLDELPELFNILKGDMSVIGPRPLLKKDMLFLRGEYKKRLTVRPGLTGLAQVSGRNALPWKAKLDYDVLYVDGLSFLADAKILFQTIIGVLGAHNVDYDGSNAEEDYGVWLLQSGQITPTEFSAISESLRNKTE